MFSRSLTAAAVLAALSLNASGFGYQHVLGTRALYRAMRLGASGEGSEAPLHAETQQELASSASAVQQQAPTAASSAPSGGAKKLASIELREEDIRESFAKGSGPGGQSINKTMNRVRLQHIPTGLEVVCQEARDLSTNRKLARRLLKEKLDFMANGMDSKMGKEISKKRKSKSKSASRTRAKKASKEAKEAENEQNDAESIISPGGEPAEDAAFPYLH